MWNFSCVAASDLHNQTTTTMTTEKQVEAALKFRTASVSGKRAIITKIAKARKMGRDEAMIFVTRFYR